VSGLGRLWVRAALRRPGRGLLVLAGIVAMAVSTVAALVAGDSLEALFAADARARWGAVDVVVAPADGGPMEESLARLVTTADRGRARAAAPRLVLDALARSGGAREPDAQVLGLGEEERTFAAPLTGDGVVELGRLGPDEVVVNRRIAERLGVAIGDAVDLVVAVPELVEERPDGTRERSDARAQRWSPVIAGVADDAGVADLGRRATVLTRRDTLQRVTGLEGRVSALHAAAAEDGREAAEALITAYDDIALQVGLVGVPVMADALDIAEDEGGLFRGILLTLAFLVVVASVVVVVHLVLLIGQERRREVAVLRAVGATRATVRRLLTAEGAVYAAAASAIGAVLAIPLAGALAQALADHFADLEAARGREQVALALDARPAAIATGVAVVLVVAVLAVRAGARRVAALDPDAVLRGAPRVGVAAPEGTRRQAVAGGAGLLLLGMGLTSPAGSDLLLFSGLSALGLAAWLRARRTTADRQRLDAVAAAIGLVWSVVAPALLGDFGRGLQAGFGLLTVAGAAAVGCATVLATARLQAVMRLVRGWAPGGRAQAVLRTAGAYGELQRDRSGAIAAVSGIVLFMVAALAVLGSATDLPVARQRGGYDAVATAVAPLDEPRLLDASGAARIDVLRAATIPEGDFRTEGDGGEGSVPWPVRALRVDADLVTGQAFGLADALPGMADTGDALRHALATGTGVLVDRYSRPEGARAGDDLVLDTGRGDRTFTLVAVLDTYVVGGVLFPPAAYDTLFRDTGATFSLASAPAGQEPAAFAAALEAAGADVGLVARTVTEAADDVTRANRTFTDVFSLLLVLGLVVALVAVAALQGRAVRERRGQLAVLRAIGFRRRDVRRLLLAEPLLAGGIGIVIGLAVGLGVLRLLFAVGFADLAFVLEPGRLAAMTGLTAAVLVAAAALPAVIGARRDPGAAVRDLG
jgi:putative ABC transport system permease protein